MLKVDLHLHTSDDPADVVPHDAHQLIDAAVERGFDALAITLHDRDTTDPEVFDYARDRGITLLPGVERTVEGRHVLLINFSHPTDHIRTFKELAQLKAQGDGLIIAPHPFFPDSSCLRSQLDRHADVFDAVEWSYFWTRTLNFNAHAARWADEHGKPLIANSDLHDLRQLGRTYSVVFAERHPDAICTAIRDGRVSVYTTPAPKLELVRVVSGMIRRGNKASVAVDTPTLATT